MNTENDYSWIQSLLVRCILLSISNLEDIIIRVMINLSQDDHLDFIYMQQFNE